MVKRSFVLAIAALTVSAAGVVVAPLSARAADMPGHAKVPPVYMAPPQPDQFDWNGFYLGFNGGYGFGRSSWSDPAAGSLSDRFDINGGLVGGQIGYNWQVGKTVLGVESDIDWAHLSGSTAAGGVCGADGGGACSTEQSWLGTTRARLGYAFGNFLPYVTGGVAYGNIKAMQATGTSTDNKAGWTAGAGVEYGITKNWSAKAEYLHIDLGTATFMGAASRTNTLTVPITEDLVRAGLNYHW
jgi:outer membrane immunogenic protein